MNDKERELWVQNDSGMYGWWRSSGKSLTLFLKCNRVEIDRIINRILHPGQK